MKYRCGVFMYDLPEKCCVFCKKAEVMWDFTHGIYMVLCPEHKVTMKNFLKGCSKRISYPKGTDFIN